MKKVLNVSKRIYTHQVVNNSGVITYSVKPNETADIPDDVADLWLRSHEIKLVGEEDRKKDAEIERLKKELEAEKAKTKIKAKLKKKQAEADK